jgi:catechol 2,3-dioxygenase-like lactoylglutathione lyase family enzyme
MMKIWMVLAVAPAILLGQSVTGIGNFAHVVENLDKSLEFYKAALGLEVATPAGPFTGNPALMKLGDTAGAQARFAILRVPGVPAGSMGVELIEYKDIDRKPAHPRFQDPGAVNLSLRLKDFDGVVARVKKAGAHIMTLGGEPVTIRGTHSFFLQDPDGFIFEATVNNLEETVTRTGRWA